MGKKLFGSIIIVLVLIVALWVIAATGDSITINQPGTYANISANTTASDYTTQNMSVTITANNNVSNVTVYNSTDGSTWGKDAALGTTLPLCSFKNETGSSDVSFSKVCNLTGLAEGRWYFNFTTWKNLNGSLDNGSSYNDTEVVITTIDRTDPKVENQFPADNSNVTSNSVTFYYNTSDAGTNVSNCTLHLKKAGVWELNKSTIDTTITETSNQTFAITGLSDGRYLWLVSCEDHARNEGNSSSFNISVDTINPIAIITIKEENKIHYITNSIKIKCLGSDNEGVRTTKIKITKPSGATVEKTVTYADEWTAEFKNRDTNEAGLYKVDCTATDQTFANMGKASQKSFRILYEDVYVGEAVEEKPVADMDISTTEEFTGTVSGKQGESKTFSLDGVTTHTMTFLEVGFTSATIKLESDSVEVTLDVGKYKNADLDGDGKDDVKVTLVSIDEDGRAKVEVINLVKLEEKVKEEREAGLPKAEEKGRAGLWLTILVILVVIAVGYYLMKKRKGKKGQVKFSKQDLGL